MRTPRDADVRSGYSDENESLLWASETRETNQIYPHGGGGAYVGVLVVEVDDQAEGPPPHGLGGDEGVLEGGLPAGGNLDAELQRREVLDVELVILKGRGRGQRGAPITSP